MNQAINKLYTEQRKLRSMLQNAIDDRETTGTLVEQLSIVETLVAELVPEILNAEHTTYTYPAYNANGDPIRVTIPE